MTGQPQNVRFGLVRALVPLGLLLAQPESQGTQPLVVRQTRTRPDGTRMVSMRSFIGSLVRLVGMGGLQELSGFQDHLDHMFITMLFGCPPWVFREYEDVHRTSFSPNSCFHFHNASCLPDVV